MACGSRSAVHALLPHGSSAASARSFGIYTGSTIHEVAQVFAAGRSISAAAANTAVITKMVRVMMLAPFLVILSAWLRHRAGGAAGGQRLALNIPWFAVAFIGMVLFNSLKLLPVRTVAVATQIDTLLLAMAMAALGLTTRISALRSAGPRPLLLGAVLFGWLAGGGAAINAVVTAWL